MSPCAWLRTVSALALVAGSQACTIEVSGIVDTGGGGDEGAGDDGGGGGGTTGDGFEGKLSNNGLRFDPEALRAIGTDALGAWASESEANAAPSAVDDLLAHDAGLEHLEYIATCALDEGTSLVVETESGAQSFPGVYGLAPDWIESGCDTTCQRWVTACLLAHTNVAGYSVTVSLRGDHDGMAWDASIEEEFALQEAGFYGNAFVDDPDSGVPALYACFGRGLVSFDDEDAEADGTAHDYLRRRMCSFGVTCGLQSTGPCYYPPQEIASTCESDAGRAGFFGDCHTDSSFSTPDAFIPEVITTYLATE